MLLATLFLRRPTFDKFRLRFYFIIVIIAYLSVGPMLSILKAQTPINEETNIRKWKELQKLPINPKKYQLLKEFLKRNEGEDSKSIELQRKIARYNFQLAKSLKVDTIISDACIYLADLFSGDEIDSLIYYNEISYQYAGSSGDAFYMIRSLNNLVRLYSKVGKLEKAVGYARRSIKLIEKDCSYIKKFYSGLLKYNLYPSFSNHKEYLPFLDTAANKFVMLISNCGDTLEIGKSYCLLSEFYGFVGDKRNAETYIKGLKTIESTAQSKILPSSYYFDAASKFAEFNNHYMAIEYYKKFIDALWKGVNYNPHSSSIGQSFVTDMVNAHLNAMGSYEEIGEWDSCLFHTKEALRVCLLYPKEHNFSTITRFYIARSLLKLNRPAEALPYIEKALQSVSVQMKANPKMKNNFVFLALRGQIFELLKNDLEQKKSYQEANEIYKSKKPTSIKSTEGNLLIRREEVLKFFVRSGLKFHQYEDIESYMDTILEINKFLAQKKLDASQGEALMKYDYENNKKLNQALKVQAELKEKEAKTQKLLSVVFFLGLCVSGGSGFWAYRKSKETQKANRVLIEKNNLISEQKAELENAYEELNATVEQVNRQSKEISEKNDKISDSITYASKIQTAFLPTTSALRTAFPESFLYFSPRDVVSGDFYWLRRVNDLSFLVVADCTGHGVPGAFMSLVAGNALYQVIVERQINDPAEILTAIDLRIRSALRQDQNSDSKDGMDIAICVIPQDRSRLEYAGAGRTIYILRNSEIIETEPDKFPVGGAQHENKLFNTHRIELQPKDRIYMFTDGITDQFGGPNRRKFTPKRLKNFITDHAELTMEEQGQLFHQIFLDWKNQSNASALDDATLFAFEIRI